jgi:hypothetical protein
LSVPVEAFLAGDGTEPDLGASNLVLGEAGDVAGLEDLGCGRESVGEESAKPVVALETLARSLAIKGVQGVRSSFRFYAGSGSLICAGPGKGISRILPSGWMPMM